VRSACIWPHWGARPARTAKAGAFTLSTDGGYDWRSVLDRDKHIYDVTIDVRHTDLLYACGFESSA
jgi:hypothetical protein